eukprot:Seg1796.10 transcript_id=Seg1796.10/GoldUCD/mRNA.D3Y31 product="hypothetical protein" protein_id=Seg1796.10/GoldUCD/D3Y31
MATSRRGNQEDPKKRACLKSYQGGNQTRILERTPRGFADEDPAKVREWSQKIEGELAEFEDMTEELQTRMRTLQREEQQRITRENEELKEEARRREFDEALKLEEAKMDVKRRFEKEIAESRERSMKEQQGRVKLPKLVISKFQGTHIDWQRFWSQFETEIDKSDIAQQKRDRVFHTNERAGKSRGCVYCDSQEHKSAECDKIRSVAERKKHLSTKKLCFNCTGSKHRAADCRSKFTCQRCNGKHHTSICDQEQQQIMLANDEGKNRGTVTYPVVVVKVNGVKCRALLDTGAGGSYASATLLDRIGEKPVRKENRRIDMMLQSVTQKIEVYNVNITSLDEDFSLQASVSKVSKDVLLSLPNPNYDSITSRFSHLKGIKMDDKDKKSILPVHLILGANEFSKIKTEHKPRIGKPGEPIAERTHFGWTIMSPGSESRLDNVYSTRSSSADYEQLCSLDVLGLADKPEGDQQPVYQEFKEQLIRNPEGWYETGLLWKSNHDALHNNKRATIEEHLSSCESDHPAEIEEIRRSLYVDDVISGACTVEEAQHLKDTAISVFGEANFELRKWHSNAKELETDREEKDADQSYAKEQLGVRANETKMLGLAWNKAEDSLGVAFPAKQAELTKRGVLRNLASIYDPLGFVSPVTLLGKMVYRECCDQSLPWDKELPENIVHMWKNFEKSLPTMMEVPRSLCPFQEQIREVNLHVFGDTSGKGTSAVVYAVVHQDSGISQGLLAAKARLAKKNMSLPRLELISAHMAANLVENVKDALQGFPIGNVYGWLDSTVALHWIKGNGNYKQFVANRVKLIREKNYIVWRHVRTDENPADIGSRGEKASKLSETWFKGPKWLSERSCWPEELQIERSTESEAEAKLVKEVLAVSVESTDQIDNLISKFNFWKTIRVTAFCQRFIRNCRAKRAERLQGPLTTEETQRAIQHWVIKTQQSYENTEKSKEIQQSKSSLVAFTLR